MGSLKLVLAGGATMMTTTTVTTRLALEVLGQSSPRGTYKILGLLISIPWTSLHVSLGLTFTLFSFLHAHPDYDIPFTSVRYLDILRISVLLERLHVFICVICSNHNRMRIICFRHSQSRPKLVGGGRRRLAVITILGFLNLVWVIESGASF